MPTTASDLRPGPCSCSANSARPTRTRVADVVDARHLRAKPVSQLPRPVSLPEPPPGMFPDGYDLRPSVPAPAGNC